MEERSDGERTSGAGEEEVDETGEGGEEEVECKAGGEEGVVVVRGGGRCEVKEVGCDCGRRGGSVGSDLDGLCISSVELIDGCGG